MISSILVLALAAGAAHSALVPTAPGPGQTFNEGGDCTLSWNLDTTGKWTSFTVDLMSGSNLAMQTVTNVFKDRDGTKGDTTFTWKCPQVTPHSAIYFYQFTQAGADTTWTTRFAIASPSGEVTPPANSVQPGGAAIPWGVGRLAGASSSAANQTTVTPPASANTTALNTVSTGVNATNATTTALAGTNSTAVMNNTSAMISPPKQSTSAPSSTTTNSFNKGSSSTNVASTTKTNTTAPSSGATSLVSSKSVIATLAIITLIVIV